MEGHVNWLIYIYDIMCALEQPGQNSKLYRLSFSHFDDYGQSLFCWGRCLQISKWSYVMFATFCQDKNTKTLVLLLNILCLFCTHSKLHGYRMQRYQSRRFRHIGAAMTCFDLSVTTGKVQKCHFEITLSQRWSHASDMFLWNGKWDSVTQKLDSISNKPR